MATAQVPLAINQGETFRIQLVWKTGSPAALVDLTGCTARMQLRPKPGSDQLYHELTTENGGITLGGTAGTIDLFISASDTTTFTWSAAAYDLEISWTDGTVLRLVQGVVTVSKEVTK